MKQIYSIFSLLVIGVFILSNPVNAIEYQHFGAMPAFPDPKVKDSETWFLYNLKPGERKEDGVMLVNTYDQQMSARIYAADTTRSSDGGFALKNFDAEKTDVGAWIRFYPDGVPSLFGDVFEKKERRIFDFCSLSREKMTSELGKKVILDDTRWAEKEVWCEGKENFDVSLDSNERRVVPFIITIPSGPLDVGDHTGAILVEKKVAEDGGTNRNGAAIRVTTRLGVRIYQTIPGTLVRNLEIADFSVKANDQGFDIGRWFGAEPKKKSHIVTRAKVDNSKSNVTTHFDEKLFIENKLNKKKNETIERHFQVLRGETFSFSYEMPSPGFGWFSFREEIVYKDVGGSDQILKTDVKSIFIFPWKEFAFMVAMLAVTVGVFYMYRYLRARKYRLNEWVDYQIREGDNIQNLAVSNNIPWKILAKHNGLKAPYLITVGKHILVPSQKNKTESGVPNGHKSFVENIKGKEYSLLFFIIGGALMLLGIALWMGVLFTKQDKKPVTTKKDKTEKVSSVEIKNTISTQGASSEIASSSEEQTNTPRESIRVVVLNAGAKSGSAGHMKSVLEGVGYRVEKAENAEDLMPGTWVLYAQDKRSLAKQISEETEMKSLSAKLAPMEEQYEKYQVDVIVLLGS